MSLLQRTITLVAVLAFATPSTAGVEKDSHSIRPGLFFAWLSPDEGYVSAHFDDNAHLRSLAQHCNAGCDVFSLQTGTNYKCKVQVFKTSSGEEYWDAAAVTVQGPSPNSDTRQFGLFSLAPPRTVKWIHRRITAEERNSLESLLASDARRFGTMKRQLKIASASAVQQTEDSRLSVVVPGRVVKDRDGFYYAQRHHVFVKRSGTYSYLGEIPGKPTSAVDIDGGDLPGLIVNEGCDGLCITLWSITGGLRQIGSFGGH